MKFKKVIARFETDNILLAEELICEIFFSFNLKGVICEIPLEEPDEGFGTNTLPLPEHNAIIGYLPLIDSSDVILQKIQQKTRELSSMDIKVQVLTKIVDEKDWSEAWKKYFYVTHITDRIVIKPDWKAYSPLDTELVIHLDPGMAFGTGTHPSTAMCLKLMDTCFKPDISFLDVGTGSGILMIAASLLGAKGLAGIDTDEVAVKVAHENLAKNHIARQDFDISCSTLDQTVPESYDFIAANIIAQVIVDILPDIRQRMAPQGLCILSGIIMERRGDIVEALTLNDLEIVDELNVDEWVSMVIQKR